MKKNVLKKLLFRILNLDRPKDQSFPGKKERESVENPFALHLFELRFQAAFCISLNLDCINKHSV